MVPRLPRTALLALLVASPVAQPAVFEVRASGPFEVVDPLGLLPFATPPVGATFELAFSFDDAVAAGASEASRASYVDGISALRLSVGDETYVLPSSARAISITNDCACVDPSPSVGQPYEDSWVVAQTFLRSEEGLFEGMTLALGAVSFGSFGGPLATTALVAPPSLDMWESSAFFFTVGELDPALRVSGRRALLRGNPTSLEITAVPGPSALWLLGTALGALGSFGARVPLIRCQQ
jgi:hypothetical protein